MKHVQEEVKVRVFRRRTQEEAELDDRAAGGDAPSLDGKADKAVDSVVAALESVRVLLRRRQLQERDGNFVSHRSDADAKGRQAARESRTR